ncbi:polyubiquitin-like [Triplophysa dalaica]|uniref:polyubiquitin-like n=1 Tax=Triplophysa dalaica TaxID=1582913 RepID=UPI0024E00637|nr:polyubiquitin-like [Triplophysa dalaica]
MMEIIVKGFNGNTERLTVDCDATVGKLKQLISTLFSVRPFQQKLSANNGQKTNLDDESRSLSSYGLHSGSTVVLLITNPIQVFVKNEDGRTGTYEVYPDETVDQLQAKIYNKERVPVDQQKLIYNCKQLMPGKKLQEYDIKPKSTIFMTLRLRSG